MSVKISWLGAVAALASCENASAPAVVTAGELCSHYDDTGCLEGTQEACAASYAPDPTVAGSCENERNELRRCHWLDLPADAEAELATDPFDCVLSHACENESQALCFCERGLECGEVE